MLGQFGGTLQSDGYSVYDKIGDEGMRFAAYWAYINDFRFLAVMSLACLPLCFLFRKVAARKGAVAAH